MSKELPYFRFYPSEWLEGDITLENERTQGFFITLLSWYWKKDCIIDLEFINKRLVNGKATLKQCLNNLIESNIIKVDDNQAVTINFLDNQYDLLSEKRQKLVEAGRAGGKASLKHRLSYKDKDNNKDKYKDILNKVLSVNSIILPDGFEELILEWLKYKSEKGQSYKETGLKTLIKTFLKDTNSDLKTGQEMLNFSMTSNYAGLFKTKEPIKKEYHATDF